MADERTVRPSTPPPTDVGQHIQLTRHSDCERHINPLAVRSSGAVEEITTLRTEIALQMDEEFSKCGVESFFATYLPFSPSESDVDVFMASQTASKKTESAAIDQASELAHGDNLRRQSTCLASKAHPMPTEEQGSILITNGDGQVLFRDFQTIPTPQDASEIASYQRLQEIADAVSNATVSNRSRNDLLFQYCPNKPITSDIYSLNNQIDGSISASVAMEGTLEAHNIAVVFQFKSGNAPDVVIKNTQQAVSANVQIMNDDLRRTFTFGVTVVRDQVRVIYHGRAGSVVSEPFSIVAHPRLLIRVFMAFLFASKEELGYDPNVTRLDDGQHVFRIPGSAQRGRAGQDQFYRTNRPLSIYRSNNITGRHCRVWLVDILESPMSTKSKGRAVLKDIWLDENALTERQIQDRLFRDIYDFWTNPMVEQSPIYQGLYYLGPELKALVNGPFESAPFRDYFLHIEADWSGRERGGRDLKAAPDSLCIKVDRRCPSTNSLPEDLMGRRCTPRRQYRAVFKEVCMPVDALSTLGEVFDTLEQALTPLRLMFSAGWVHRDISAGNIMAEKVGDTLQGKLCDLEYARKFPPGPGYTAAGDPKTGTPYFMPLEILSGVPLHHQFSSTYDWTIPPGVSSRDELVARLEASAKPEVCCPPINILHNFQHDVECLFWVAMWNGTARVDYEPSQVFARKIFKNTMQPTVDRSNALYQSIQLPMIEASVAPAQDPLVTFFEAFRQALDQEYSRRAQNHTSLNIPNREEYARIHFNVDRVFGILRKSKSRDWRSVTLLQSQPVKPATSGIPAQADRAIEPPTPAPATKRSLPAEDDEYFLSDERPSEDGGSISRCGSKAKRGRH